MKVTGASGSSGASGMPKIPGIPNIPSLINRLPMCLILRKILKKQNPFMEKSERAEYVIGNDHEQREFHHDGRNISQQC